MKIKLNYFIISIVILGFLLQKCTDDKVEYKNDSEQVFDSCEKFTKPTGGGISYILEKDSQRMAPYFNPNNSYEFIYIKDENSNQTLIKYNLNTKIETVLLKNYRYLGQPKWGKNGWIIFTGQDYQVHLINENGTQLKQVTNSNYHLFPAWLNDSIIVADFSLNLGVPYFYEELRLDGSIKDTIRNTSFIFGSLNNYGKSAYLRVESDPNIYSLLNSTSTALTNINLVERSRNRISGISWHPNNEDIYFSTNADGIYFVNEKTTKITKIRNGCDFKGNKFLSVSPDGSKIILERIDVDDYVKGAWSWTQESKIYIMDIDGKNEKNVFD
jgi:hypothetical protein